MSRVVYVTACVVTLFAFLCKRADLLWNECRSIPLGTYWRAWGFTIAQMPDLAGRVALVTGATSGIGRETALQLALANATVLIGCRESKAGESVAQDIRQAVETIGGLGSVRAVVLDLADLHQVATVADRLLAELGSLHILINNAGIATQFPHTLTTDGLEATFQVNYLGHFLLTTRLLPLLERSAPARVVHMSSGAHRGAPQEGVPLSRVGINDPLAMGAYARYGMAKLASLVFAKELDRVSSHGIFSNAVHPGVVATGLLRSSNFEAMLGKQLGAIVLQIAQARNQIFAYSPQVAALTLLYCAASRDIEQKPVRGELLVPIAQRWPARHEKADDLIFGQALWNFSNELLQEALL